MIAMGWKRLVVVLTLVGSAGCVSYSMPAGYYGGESAESKRMWGLVDPDSRKEILAGGHDREKLKARVGVPTIDDGAEWVYVGKFEETTGVAVDMVMAVAASKDRPKWKTVVVTFDAKGKVEKIREGSVESAIAERERRDLLLGVGVEREARLRGDEVKHD